VPKKSSSTAPTVPHNCVTFDDGRGRKWHVPFDEVGSVPRVGEEVLLPNPPGAYKRHSVVSVVYLFVQRAGPDSLKAEQPGSRQLVSCRSSARRNWRSLFSPLQWERDSPAPGRPSSLASWRKSERWGSARRLGPRPGGSELPLLCRSHRRTSLESWPLHESGSRSLAYLTTAA
jgi:hypothetical protein